jgi:serine/threonine protein kinase
MGEQQQRNTNMIEKPRRSLKGYELYERVGTGGFGEVYRAHQPAVGREVAIKVILPQYANQPDFVRRFEVEAQTFARLEHPHIVPLYDWAQTWNWNIKSGGDTQVLTLVSQYTMRGLLAVHP